MMSHKHTTVTRTTPRVALTRKRKTKTRITRTTTRTASQPEENMSAHVFKACTVQV